MSKSFSSLVSSAHLSAESFVRKATVLPDARFLVQVASYELLPRFWEANAAKGLADRAATCYVPTYQIIDYFPCGDSDRDEFTLQALDEFGDWKGKKLHMAQKGQIATKGPETILLTRSIPPGAYALFEMDPTFETAIGPHPDLARFLTLEGLKVTDGYVTILSLEPSAMVPIELVTQEAPIEAEAYGEWIDEIIAATEDCYAVLEVSSREWKSEKTGKEGTSQEFVSLTSVA
jgi:hypothetical protein